MLNVSSLATYDELISPNRFLFATMMAAFCVTTAIANVFVLFIVLITKQLRHVASVFTVHLTVVDLLIATLIQPFLVSGVILGQWIHSSILCEVLAYATHILLTSSNLAVVSISVDRYLAIIHCLSYTAWVKSRYAMVMIAWIWTQSLATACLPSTGLVSITFDADLFSCSIKWSCHSALAIFVTTINFILPCAVMLYSYARVIYVTRSQIQRIIALCRNVSDDRMLDSQSTIARAIFHSGRVTSFVGSQQCLGIEGAECPHAHRRLELKRHSLREVSTALRLIILFIAFVSSWLLYYLVNFQCPDANVSITRWDPSSSLSISFAMFGITLNPFLYSVCSCNFRRAVRRIFNKRVFPVEPRGLGRSCKAYKGQIIASQTYFHTNAERLQRKNPITQYPPESPVIKREDCRRNSSVEKAYSMSVLRRTTVPPNSHRMILTTKFTLNGANCIPSISETVRPHSCDSFFHKVQIMDISETVDVLDLKSGQCVFTSNGGQVPL